LMNPVAEHGEDVKTLMGEKFQRIHPKTASFQVEDVAL